MDRTVAAPGVFAPVRALAALVAVLVMWPGNTAQAQTQETWDLANGAGNWSVDTNWLDDTAPVGSNTLELIFGGLDPDSYNANNDLGVFLLNRLTLGSTSTATNTISGNQLQFGGTTPTISQQGSGAFVVSNDIELLANLLLTNTVDGTGAVELSGIISESAAGRTLTHGGTGTFVLSGANTYTGNTTVNGGGVLNLRNGSAIGTGAVAVSGSSTIELQGNITVSNVLSITGTGVGGGGALRNVSGNNHWASQIELTGSTTIASDSGTLTVGNGGVALDTNNATITLTLGGDGDGVVNGTIGNSSGTGGNPALVKTGAGTWTLNGAFNAGTNTITISDGTLRYGVVNALPSSIVNVNGGTLDIQSFNDTVGRTNSGGVTVQNGGTVTGTTGVLTSQATTGQFAWDLRDGTVSANIAMSPTRNLVKWTSGTVVLSGTNNAGLSGAAQVRDGTLILESRAALGDGGGTNHVLVRPNQLGGQPVLSLAGASGSLVAPGGSPTGNANDSYTFADSAVLRFDNTVAYDTGLVGNTAHGRWHDDAALRLDGSTLQFIGNSTVATTEVIGDLQIAAGARIVPIAGATDVVTTLQAQSLVRVGNATLVVNGTSGRLGIDERITFDTTDPTVTNGIIAPWAINGADNTFLTYDGSSDANGEIGLVNAAFSSTDLTSSGDTDIVGTGAVDLTADASAFALSASGAITGAHTVTIGSGGFIADSSLANPTHTANFQFGTGAGGDAEALLFVAAGGSATLEGTLSTNAGLNKFGLGTAILTGDSSGTLSGGVRINGGTLEVRNTAALFGNTVEINGGILSLIHDGFGDDGIISYDYDVTVGAAAVSTIHVGNAGQNTGNVVELRNIAFAAADSMLEVTGANGYSLAFTGGNDIELLGTIVIGGSGDVIFGGSGGIFGVGGFNKQGSGIFTIAQAGTYDGQNTVGTSEGAVSGVVTAGGILRVQHVDALGSAVGNTRVFTGSELQIDLAGTNTINEAITLTGGTLTNLQGNNRINNTVTIDGTATIASDAGTLTIGTGTGNAIAGNITLTLTGSGDGVVDGNRTASTRNLTKSGSGKWTLLGTAATTTGTTTVSAGVLNIQNSLALGVNAANGTGNVSVSAGAALELQGGITVGLPGNAAVRTLTVTSTGIDGTGALRNISGDNAWLGNITLSTNPTIASDSGTLTLGQAGSSISGNTSLTLTGEGNGIIAGNRTGNTTRALTKNGTGTWTILGTNSNVSGTVTVNLGTLIIRNDNALGTDDGTFLVNVVNGGTLELQGGITVGDTVNNTGQRLRLAGNTTDAALRNVSDDNTWLGFIELNADSKVIVDSGTLTIGNGTEAVRLAVATTNRVLTLGGAGDGVLNGTISANGTNTAVGGFFKTGDGTWTLTGTADYTGNSTLTGGTLRAQNQTSLGTGALALLPSAVGGSARLIVEGALGTLVAADNSANANSSFSMAGNTVLTFDNTVAYSGTSTQGRWHDTAAISLFSSTVQLIGNDTVAVKETIGALSFAGSSAVEIVRGGAGVNVTLEATNAAGEAFNRTDRGTVRILGTAGQLGADERLTVSALADPAVVNGLNGGADSMAAAFIVNGTDRTFVTYDATVDGVGTIGFRNVNYSASTLDAAVATDIIDTAGEALTDDAVAHALRATGDITGGFGVTLASGGLISENATHAANFQFGAGAGGDAEALVMIPNGGVTTINGVLSSTVGLTKFGLGTLVLGADNSATLNGGSAFIAEGTLQLAADGALGAATNDLTVSGATLDLQTFNTSAATVTLQRDGTITGTGGTLSGTSYVLERGLLAVNLGNNAATVTKQTTGTVVMSGNNAYTGATTIDDGVLVIQHVNALGTTDSGTTVTGPGELHIDIAGTNNIDEAITMGVNGTVRNVQGDNTITSLITIVSSASNRTFAVDAGTLTLGTVGSTALNGSGSLILTGEGNGVLAGNRTGVTNRPATKSGFGTWTLLGTSSNTTGSWTVSQGTLNVQNQGALGLFGAAHTGSTTVSTGATLELQAPTNGGFTFGLAGTPATRPMSLSGTGFNNVGALRNVSGNNVWLGNITLAGTTSIAVDAGSLTLGQRGAATSTLSAGTRALTLFGDGNGVINADIVATGNTATITKNGTGTWTLMGSRSGTNGAITINSGILNIQHSEAVGSNDAGVTANVTVTSGAPATLQLQGGITVGRADEATVHALSLVGVGVNDMGALNNVSGDNTWLGNIALTGTTAIISDAGTLTLGSSISALTGNSTLTLGGAGNGIVNANRTATTRSLTKTGSGTWSLRNSANVTSGLTNINEGVLNLQHSEALGVNGATGLGRVTVAIGAALELEGNISVGDASNGDVRPLTLGGTGIGGAGALRNIGGNNAWLSNIDMTSDTTFAVDAGSLTVGSANSALAMGNQILTLTGPGNGSLNGQVSGGAAAGIVKTGGGSWTLSAGSNATFGGSVAVNEGDFVVDGSLDSGGGVVVNAGGTLSGSGTIFDNVTINAGGVGSPGNSPEKMTIDGNFTWDAGSGQLFEINNATGAPELNWDYWDITGVLTIGATTGSPITIDIDSLTASDAAGAMDNFNAMSNYTWLWATAAGGIDLASGDPLSSLFAFDVSGVQSAFASETLGAFSVFLGNGAGSTQTLSIQYTAVPEPGSVLLCGLAAAGLCAYGWRRRRTRSAAPLQESASEQTAA